MNKWNERPVHNEQYTMEQAFGGDGAVYRAPNGREFRIYVRNQWAVAYAPDDPMYDYRTPTYIHGAWEALKYSIDFDNPKV